MGLVRRRLTKASMVDYRLHLPLIGWVPTLSLVKLIYSDHPVETAYVASFSRLVADIRYIGRIIPTPTPPRQ